MKSARKAYAKRLTWRRKFDVENIFSKYQSNFDDILKYYPHAIHGRSKEGCAIVYELIGQGNPKELLGLGITPDSLLWHFNLRNEFIFRQLGVNSSGPADNLDEKDRVTHLMTIIDVKGISVSDFTTDVISFMQKSSDVIETYYIYYIVVCLSLNTY